MTAIVVTGSRLEAVRYKQSVAIFSLEMSKEQLVQRLLCMQGRLDNGRLRSGYIDEDEWTRLIDAAKAQSEFVFADIEGTLVGLWSPGFSSAFSVAGYHLHFLSADRQHGGHLLDVESVDGD